MKTRPTSALVLLAVLSAAFAAPLVAAPSSSPVTSYRVRMVERFGRIVVRAGDPAAQVTFYLGQPDQKLSPNTWVYRHLEPVHNEGQNPDCTVLLVSFSQSRVTDIQRVNEPAVAWLVARHASPKNVQRLAARN